MAATHATVTINSIRVIDSSVNTTSEPGSSAEWYLTFVVNGQSAQWSHDSVRDETVYAVNKVFPNVPLGPKGMVSIQVSGYEHDSTSANDTLPTLQKTLHPATEYQLGGTDWVSSPSSPEGTYAIEFTIEPAQGQALSAAREYVGVFHPGAGGYALWAANWEGFIAKWKALSGEGLRLSRLATFWAETGQLSFADTTERMFVGIFDDVPAGQDGHALWVSEWASFESKWKELSAAGLRLIDLATYQDGDKRMFAGVFRQGTGGHALWVAEWGSFENKWKELSASGLRLVSLDTYPAGNTRIFTGVFREGDQGHALWVGDEWPAFSAKVKECRKQGLGLVDVCSYAEGNRQRFGGVFLSGLGGLLNPVSLVREPWQEFVERWRSLSAPPQISPGPLRGARLGSKRLAAIDTFVQVSEE